jgi:hypothetical protein
MDEGERKEISVRIEENRRKGRWYGGKKQKTKGRAYGSGSHLKTCLLHYGHVHPHSA